MESATRSRWDRCGTSPPRRGAGRIEGPVGSRWLGRFRAFRYEMRCWPGGSIPDVAEAVESPVRTTEDAARVAAVLDVLGEMPVLTWGRDELGAGEMWNSNAAVAWALARTGHDMGAIWPPRGGRAPGWKAGLVLADRQARAMAPDLGPDVDDGGATAN